MDRFFEFGARNRSRDPGRFSGAAGAQVDCRNLIVCENLRGGAFDQFLAEIEHQRPSATFTHDADDMLDNHDRYAWVRDRADERDQFGDLAVDQAGADLVQQHDARLERQRARDLEPLAPEERQGARAQPRDVGEPGAREQRRPLFPSNGRANERRDRILRDFEIFFNGHVEERPWDLIGAADAGPRTLGGGKARNVAAVEPDRTLAGRDRAADQAAQRRFSRAIRPNNAGDRSRPQLQVDMVDRHQAAVTLDETGNFQKRRRARTHAVARLCVRKDKFAAKPTTPFGAKRINTIRMTPAIATCASG